MHEPHPCPNDHDKAWAIAVHRAEVLRILLENQSGLLRGAKVAAAANELGISRAGLYRLLARYKAMEVPSSLLPVRSGRPTGTRFLDEKRETIIAAELEQFYLQKERPRLSELFGRICTKCDTIGVKPPNWRTVHGRARDYNIKLKERERQNVAPIEPITVISSDLGDHSAHRLIQNDKLELACETVGFSGETLEKCVMTDPAGREE